MAIKVGDAASASKLITDEDVRAYAELVGDRNSIHLDEEFARRTPFGRRIAHGMYVASLISSVIAEQLPGPGSVYLGQTLQFLAPVFLDDTVTARVTVSKMREDKPIITLETLCLNQHGETVIKGEAVVKTVTSDK